MLVLTRKKDESIIIGNNIKITILDIRKDGTVRVGITAPANLEIHREEVFKQIQKENRLAADFPKDLHALNKIFEDIFKDK